MSRSKATRRLLKYVGRTSSWKNNTIKYHDWGTRETQVVKENFVWFFVGGVRGGVILRENLITRVWVCFFVCSPVVFCNCWLILVVVCYFVLFLLFSVVVCCEVGRVADQSSRVCFPSTLAPTFSLHCIILRGVIIVLALLAFCHILLSDIKIGGLRRFLVYSRVLHPLLPTWVW